MLLSNPADTTRTGIKFTRRNDLDPATRLYIAYTALTAQMFGLWGTVTQLSRDYAISRTFVYMLANTLEESMPVMFGPAVAYTQTLEERNISIQLLLSLRLEGKCSIDGVSTIMKRIGAGISSAGLISRLLTETGKLLPDTLETGSDSLEYVVYLSDEIFAHSVPILITVEPASSAILKIELADNRKAEQWKKHFESIQNNGYIPWLLVTDEGPGLCTAHADILSDVTRQPDTYHAVAHTLGQWANRLEQAAYKAISVEYNCEQKLNSAKSDLVVEKRLDAYFCAVNISIDSIKRYEDFCYLYSNIIKNLQPFDKAGNLRNRKKAEKNIDAALDLIIELNHAGITKQVMKVKRVLPELLNYFDTAELVISECKDIAIDGETLKTLCVAWQWEKEAVKSKNIKRKQRALKEELFYLEFAEGNIQDGYHYIKQKVYRKLDKIVQSSALVECINSIIRPYLNTSRNHITQEQLNLIMFYHNHRRYHAGKRKGYTPMEILTGIKQEKDWTDIIIDIIREKSPGLLLNL